MKRQEVPSGFHLFPELVKLKNDRRFGDPLRLVQDFRENLLACFVVFTFLGVKLMIEIQMFIWM